MSTPIQDRSITIFHNGKPITWRPRDQTPPPASTSASPPAYTTSFRSIVFTAEAQPEVASPEIPRRGRKTKLKASFKKAFKKLFPQMATKKQPTKVFNTGVDTISCGKPSLVNRLKFWKLGHKQSESPCEGCRSWNARPDPNDRNPSGSEDDLVTNPLGAPSVNQEIADIESLQRMVAPSEISIPRSVPIAIPGPKKSSRGCCPRRGKENQRDGNFGNQIKDAAYYTSLTADDMIHISVERSPVLSPHHFAQSEESVPEDGQLPSPVRECYPIDEETMSDLELSPSGLVCKGLSADVLQVPRDVEYPISVEIRCPPGDDLEADLREAMETSLPRLEAEADQYPSPATPTAAALEHKADGPEISITESFSRTRSSLSSIDGHSAPTHSFLIEGPYSRLGSDFVDVEDYLQNPRSTPSPPKYPNLDSSATTEDFGFRPTCEHMPGSWPEERTSQERLPDEIPSLKGQGFFSLHMSRLLDSDSEDPPSFEISQKEVLETFAKSMGQEPDTKYSFARCRPIPGTIRDSSLLPPSSPNPTIYSLTTSLHLRGGGDESRFSLFRPVGKGKLKGDVERGKALLNEPVSGTYMIGGWGREGRNETWREFATRMEKRVEKRKQIEKLDEAIDKLKAEKEAAGGKGFFGEAVSNVKGWFVSDTPKEGTEEIAVTVTEQRTRIVG